jgi:O-antigen biosynthesis protein WbqP
MTSKALNEAMKGATSYRGKRLLDLLLAIGLSIPATPVILISAVVIYLECRANPLFVQYRIGQNGKLFKLLKLRTMRPNTANVPSHEIKGSQMLESGAWLRRTKIDELPQILNILKGEMSFVGPRPCLPGQTELIEARKSRGVDQFMPGISGVAQIAGIDMSTPVELAEADSGYRHQLSFVDDVSILYRTFTGAGRGDAVKS